MYTVQTFYKQNRQGIILENAFMWPDDGEFWLKIREKVKSEIRWLVAGEFWLNLRVTVKSEIRWSVAGSVGIIRNKTQPNTTNYIFVIKKYHT